MQVVDFTFKSTPFLGFCSLTFLFFENSFLIQQAKHVKKMAERAAKIEMY